MNTWHAMAPELIPEDEGTVSLVEQHFKDRHSTPIH